MVEEQSERSELGSEHGEVTQRFQAFAESVDPAPSHTLPVGLILGAAVILGALIGTVVFLLV